MKKEILCPKCKEEISYLEYYLQKVETGQFSVDKNGFEEWDSNDRGVPQDEILKEEYRCPDCNEILFKDAEVARLFLIK